LFGEENVMLIESWPALKALRKERGTPWMEFTPKFHVIRLYRPRKKPEISPQLELNLGAIPVKRSPDSLANQRIRAFDQFHLRCQSRRLRAGRDFKAGNGRSRGFLKGREETLEFAALNPAPCFALGNVPAFFERPVAPHLETARFGVSLPRFSRPSGLRPQIKNAPAFRLPRMV
jgi:hypothetical protein